MNKNFFGFPIVAISTVISSAIAAIFWLYIASEIGPESYGELTYLISIASLVSGFALFGTNETIMVFSAKKVDVQKTLFYISLFSSAISAIVIFLIFDNFGVSFLIIAYVLFGLITSDLLGKKLYGQYAKNLLIQKILLVGLGIGFYYLFGENGILIGIALSHGYFIIELIKILKKSKFNFKFFKEKKKFILNSFALSITDVVAGSMDKLLIAPLLGFVILGNYSLGLQFFSILLMLPGAAIKYLIPQDASGILNKKLKIILVLMSISIALLSYFFSPMVISNIFPKFNESEDIIRIISWAIIPITINSVIFIPKLWAQEKNKIILFVTIISLVSQIIGIFSLGFMFSANGIALSFVISMSIGTVCYLILDKFKK